MLGPLEDERRSDLDARLSERFKERRLTRPIGSESDSDDCSARLSNWDFLERLEIPEDPCWLFDE